MPGRRGPSQQTAVPAPCPRPRAAGRHASECSLRSCSLRRAGCSPPLVSPPQLRMCAPQSSWRCRPGPAAHRGRHPSQTSPRRPLTFVLLPASSGPHARQLLFPSFSRFLSHYQGLRPRVSCLEHWGRLLPGPPDLGGLCWC